MKKIALALLSTAVMADQGCAPEAAWGTQNHFSVEFAGGAATMGGSPYSTTPTAAFPDQIWNDVALQNGSETIDGSYTLEVVTPVGYRANWNQMQGNPNRLGFAAQLNMHYLAVQGNFAGGVYAGIGYNGAHSSSTIQGTFDNTVYVNQVANPVLSDAIMNVSEGPFSTMSVTNGTKSSYASLAQQPRAAMNANQPPAKATVSSGLMFQAGTRMGVMIGNVFPHLRLGWAAYQLKAHMTGQIPAGSKTSSGELYAKSTQALTWDSSTKTYAAEALAAGDSVLMGISQQTSLEGVNNLYNLPKTIKIASKGSKWANALTLGAGVDWAWQKMTFGFYYQAAMCQRVTFKQWNKAVSAGVTSSDVNWQTTSTANPVATAGATDPTKLTGTSVTNTYGASVPSLSISPVIHSAMFSVKYVINKA